MSAPKKLQPRRRDMERGLFFMHTLSTQNRKEAQTWQIWIQSLVEQMVAAGLVDQERFNARVESLRRAQYDEQLEKYLLCRVGVEDDKYHLQDLPEIDCLSRLPLCGARCCTFTHLLSTQDLQEGQLEWELARPYVIRSDPSGYCVHHCKESQRCRLYEARPASCRRYDCREDKRIWQDFERRILAES